MVGIFHRLDGRGILLKIYGEGGAPQKWGEFPSSITDMVSRIFGQSPAANHPDNEAVLFGYLFTFNEIQTGLLSSFIALYHGKFFGHVYG